MAFVAAGSQRLHYVSNSDSERKLFGEVHAYNEQHLYIHSGHSSNDGGINCKSLNSQYEPVGEILYSLIGTVSYISSDFVMHINWY